MSLVVPSQANHSPGLSFSTGHTHSAPWAFPSVQAGAWKLSDPARGGLVHPNPSGSFFPARTDLFEKENNIRSLKKTDAVNSGASKWVSAFKVTSAILVTGAMNAFLFGVPLHTAAMLSLLIAGFQSVVALKIHREDNGLSRALVQKTRCLMGREKDKTASGKEWAMVPIWGGVCATSGLMEAMMNHAILARRKSLAAAEGKPYQPPTLESRKNTLLKSAKETRFGLLRKIYEFQSNRLTWMLTQKDRLTSWLNQMKANSQSPMRQRFANGMEWLLARIQNSSGGRNIPLGYLWAMFTAAAGGMIQTAMAAKLQEKIDGTHATHPTAPKPTALKNREPGYFPGRY